MYICHSTFNFTILLDLFEKHLYLTWCEDCVLTLYCSWWCAVWALTRGSPFWVTSREEEPPLPLTGFWYGPDWINPNCTTKTLWHGVLSLFRSLSLPFSSVGESYGRGSCVGPVRSVSWYSSMCGVSVWEPGCQASSDGVRSDGEKVTQLMTFGF